VAIADELFARRPDFPVRDPRIGPLETTPGHMRQRSAEWSGSQPSAGPAPFMFVDPGEFMCLRLMPSLDLFLMTSVPHSEGVSTTVLEAMASGIPVVSTDVGALSEVVVDGVTGRIVAPLDDRAMVEAVGALLMMWRPGASMGAEARRRADGALWTSRWCADTHMRALQ